MDPQAPSPHPLDWNAKLVRFFFDNAKLVWLLIICILLGGGFSLLSLRKEGFPSFEIKTVMVQTFYPGATSSEVESKVTKPLEANLKELSNLKEYSSVSQNSYSQIMVSFNEDADLNKAVQDTQSAINAAAANLPTEIESPKVKTLDVQGPAFLIAVPDPDLVKARTNATLLASEIANVTGVTKAESSQNQDQIIIKVDPPALQKLGLSLATLSQVLQANNLNYPSGLVTVDQKEQTVLTMGAYRQLADIQNLILGANPATRQPIYLKDVATVTQEPVPASQIERVGVMTQGQLQSVPGVLVSVEVSSTVDIIQTKTAILDQINKAQTAGRIDQALNYQIVYDLASQTQDQVSEIMSGAIGSKDNFFLLGGIQLLFLAMLLLVNWRAALIAALSIPFAFGITFIVLFISGIQLNTIVLFSFILVLGLIVDPAIVMVEAIQRYRDLKYPPREAVIESARRYGASLFMAVLTSVIVFVPFGVVSGFFGQIIKYIPLTMVPALVASYLVPVAILPYLTKKVLPYKLQETAPNQISDQENLSKAALLVMRVNSWILNSKWRQSGVAVLTVLLIAGSLSIVALQKIQTVQFATPEDNDMLLVQAQFNKGLSVEQKSDYALGLEKLFSQESGVLNYFYSNQGGSALVMYVDLKPIQDRPEQTNASKQILSRIKEASLQLPGFSDVFVSELTIGPPANSYQISTNLESADLAKLESAAISIGSYLASLEHVTKVDDGFSGKLDSELHIQLSPAKVQMLGLSSYEIGSQLKAVLEQVKVGKLTPDTGDPMEIKLTTNLDPKAISAIEALPLTTRAGSVIKVSDVATVVAGNGVSSINHYNGLRYATVQARVDEQKNVTTVQKQFDQYLSADKLKELGIDNKLAKGDVKDFTKSFTDLGIALLIAIMLTYVVLVLQFKSFSLPLIMLFTIPLSLIGVFPILWLTGSQFGFLELVGITILVGIVENVAIFLIDYANQLVLEKGLTPKEAIIQASGVRFRPILLTKLVALGGLLPLAIESPLWRGLSVVIMAGIGLSGFFSLVIIPILYVFVMKLRARPILRRTRQLRRSS